MSEKLNFTNYRPSDYRTPRSLNDAFGPYAKLDTAKRDSAWAYVGAVAVMVALGLMFAWRG